MKYTLKNIKNFIKDDLLIFIMVVVTVMVSGLMIHFSYAVFQNYEIKKESISEEQSYILILGDYEFEQIVDENLEYSPYKLMDYSGETITVGQLKIFGNELDKRVYDKIIDVSTGVNFHSYNIPCNFGYYDYGIGLSKVVYNNAQNGLSGITGRYFTEDDFKENRKVALVFDYQHINVGNCPLTMEQLYDENHIKLGDELFEIIGYHGGYPDTPEIPITAMSDDTQVIAFIRIDFEDSVTLYEYQNVCEAAQKAFGDLVWVEPVKLPNVDTIRLYNTIIIIAVIISVIAAINFAILYRYILKKRYKQISYMRLCGMKYSSTVIMYLGECLLISVPVYVLTAFSFAKWILPWMSDVYAYGFDSYNSCVYIALFGIYFGISLVVLLVMLFTGIKKNRIISEG